MSDRQTGATDAQIEAAIQQRYTETSATGMGIPWARLNSLVRRSMANCFERDAARYLVPPGKAITDAERVPTDDELAAMRLMVNARLVPSVEPHVWRDAVRTVRAYLERQKP